MSTHDFGPGRRAWGHNYEVMKIEDDGQRLKLAVWSPRILKVGDWMLLDNHGRPTRYEVTRVEFPAYMDPDDMYFVEAAFAPRQAGVTP